MVNYKAKPLLSQYLVNLGIVGTCVNNNNYLQGDLVVKEFSTDLYLKHSFRRQLELMKGKFQYQGYLDKVGRVIVFKREST